MRALDGLDLTIEPGERVAIVGQNGSGKSTLVRHFNGLLRPTKGRVLLDGVDASSLRVAQLAARVGLVFQDPDRQVFSRSVRAEVGFGPRNLGVRGDQLAGADRLGPVGCGPGFRRRHEPIDLGTSRRKLLALASILAMTTPVLALDEPTTGQDLRGAELVRRVIDAVSAEGRTVIAISHDMRFVAETFARVVVLREGRVVLDGPPSEAFARPAWPVLRSTFLEPPYAWSWQIGWG